MQWHLSGTALLRAVALFPLAEELWPWLALLATGSSQDEQRCGVSVENFALSLTSGLSGSPCPPAQEAFNLFQRMR